jgi:hypothetical protein
MTAQPTTRKRCKSARPSAVQVGDFVQYHGTITSIDTREGWAAGFNNVGSYGTTYVITFDSGRIIEGSNLTVMSVQNRPGLITVN